MAASEPWSQWSKHVLAELERLEAQNIEMAKCITNIKLDVVRLQMKAGAIGAVCGTIPALIALIFHLLGK